jgi:hypothetical protein
MQQPSHLLRAIGFALASILATGLLVPRIAIAAVTPPASAPAQYFGPPVWPSPFGFGADSGSPYVGSPGYPYYRYGASYGNAFGAPYPAYPSHGDYYGGAAATVYPSYSSAGGVMFNDTFGTGYYAPVGRCVYSAGAGYGGSWTDPSSYGYYAPSC